MTEVESNECLDNNGGCWQDKSANITACKVHCDIPGNTLYVYILICLVCRILFVEEYASVLELMVCNSKGTDTATVNVSVIQ